MHADDDMSDLSREANVRVAFDVWPADRPLPDTLDDVARAAFAVTLPDLLAGRGTMVHLVRFATEGVSLWLLDALGDITVEDFARAVSGAFEPAAFAIAVIQPMKAKGDPVVRGIHCRAMLGDALIDLSGAVSEPEGPIALRGVPEWTVRHGRARDDRGRWIGVPPTVEIRLPLMGAGEA